MEVILKHPMKKLNAYLMIFLLYTAFAAFYSIYQHENFWHHLIGFLMYAVLILFFAVCIPLFIRKLLFQKTIRLNDSLLKGLSLALGFLFLTFCLRHNGLYTLTPRIIELISSVYMIIYVNFTIKNLFGLSCFGMLMRTRYIFK